MFDRRSHPRSRSWPATLAVTGALALAPGCGSKESASPAKKGETVAAKGEARSLRPERRDIRMRVSQPGTIQAYESTPVYARISGYIDKYHVNIGDRVKAGDPLFTMWIPDLVEALNQKKAAADRAAVQIRVAESVARATQSSLDNAEAHIVSAAAGVKRSQAVYSRWESEYGRLKQLVVDQVLNSQVRDETYRQFEDAAAARDQANAQVTESNASRDMARANLERAKVDIEAARADLEVATAEVRQAQVQVDYGRIKAPYDGVITERNVSPGDYIQVGAGTGLRPLFVLEQTDPVRVFVGVPELAAGFIKDEDTALVGIQAVLGATRKGKIKRSGFSLNPTTRTLQTEIDIPNPDGHLRPGMYATVTITIERLGVLAVPSKAVIAQSGHDYALDFKVGDKVVRTPVLIGPSDDQYTEILRKRGGGEPGAEEWVPLAGDEEVVGSASIPAPTADPTTAARK